jgi:hypothetical protein
MDAIYRVDGNRVVTSANAAGPWDAGMQHGSAPAALVIWAAEAIPTREKIQLCAVRLLAENVVVVGTVLRTQLLKLPPEATDRPAEVPGSDSAHEEQAAFSSSPLVRRPITSK